MKTILITGAAGFLGSHLCARYIAQGHRVIAIDNLLTGRMENLSPLLTHHNFTFFKHDIILPFHFQEKIDWILNFACPASPPHYQKDPLHTLKTSVLGALNMLELARANNARIMQASTSEVYGDPEQHPQKESYRGAVNPIGPRACYDEGKRCAETLFFDYHRMYGTEIKVVRIFNTYGPHMDPTDGRVVSNLIIQALKNEPLSLYGTGKQTRSFCYVDDLIDGIMAMMNSDTSLQGPINLGNPYEFTIFELAAHVLELTKSSSTITFSPLPVDDPQQRCPDISKAKELLAWEPTIQLHQGLIKTIEYFSSLVTPIKTSFIKKETSLS